MTPIKALLLVIIASSCCVATSGTPLANGVKYGNKFFCFKGFTQCPSGIEQCINSETVCDGVEDCPDGSDEGTWCAFFDCPSAGRYDCPSGANFCMNVTAADGFTRHPYPDAYKYYLCDGVKDCADGSDEDPGFCATYDCVADVSHREWKGRLYFDVTPPTRVRCPGPDNEKHGGCAIMLCNGIAECAGGSDESDKLCQQRGCARSSVGNSLFQCRSGRCLDQNLMCDGHPDCPHGDDEGSWCATVECPSPYERVKCPGGHNQTCIHKGRMCDGVRDCPDGTDEVGCHLYACYYGNCPSGLCPSQPMGLCDGIQQCHDGSDENPDFCRMHNCSVDMRKCKDGLQCISDWLWCDGEPQCLDGSDEDPDSCAAQEACQDTKVHCPGQATTCISGSSICDGRVDCLDGSDENATFCASKEAQRIMEASSRIYCKNGTGTEIIYGAYCDGRADCADGADENESFCKSYTCLPDRVKCYGTWCVPGGRCDGVRNCPDGSDEAGCGAVSAPLPPRAPATPSTGGPSAIP